MPLSALGHSRLASAPDRRFPRRCVIGGRRAVDLSHPARARRDGDLVVIEVEDEGRPLSPELRSSAFTLAGQFFLKGRADGRYGRGAGLFVAGILAQAAGAELTAFERAGRNVFFVTLNAV